jgi:hypothetical protein
MMCKIQPSTLLLILFWIPHLISGQIKTIPNYSVTICKDKTKGYYFFVPIRITPASAAIYAPFHVILDETGKLIYYRKLGLGQSPNDFKIQPNGQISYYNNEKFYLMDSTLTVIDSVFCKNAVMHDGHDLKITADGKFLLLGYENLKMDLSSYHFFKDRSAGSPSATVKSGIVQELDKNKNVTFEWHAKDHYNFMDVDTSYLSDPADVDWTHFNAIDYDRYGDLLVSVRNFHEITKIDKSKGTIAWRWEVNATSSCF